MTNPPNEDDETKNVAVTAGSTNSTTATSRGVTYEEGTNLDDGGDAEALRRRFVSNHRHTLDHIAVDAALFQRHVVPSGTKKKLLRSDSTTINEEDENGTQTTAAFNSIKRLYRKTCQQLSERSRNDWICSFIPAWSWLQTYNFRTTLTADLIAGCTVGLMVVPQSMSYAKLAGLPVEYGLYSALIPLYAYAIFGSSRQLAVGPVALVSLLLSTGLTKALGPDDDTAAYQRRYETLAVQTSLLVGLVYIGMGLCRLGFVTILLSHAVISGFTSGASVIIGVSQLKYLFGYDIARSDKLHETLHLLFEKIERFNYRPFLMGTMSVLALVGFKHVGKTYPKYKWVRAAGPLIVTATALILTVAFGLNNRGIKVVGHIPRGFPEITVKDWLPLEGDASNLSVLVISIVIVGFMESIAIAKQLASKHKYDIDASTELIGLGMANFLGSAFQAYPVTGSFSRSAVNNESGAQSGIAGIVTATIVCVALLFLTPVFEKLPLNTLAAIVISGVLGLFDYEEAIYLYKVHFFDFLVWMAAFAGTMFAGVDTGLAIAAAVSLLIVVYESAYPQTSVMGRLPGTSYYRNVKQYPDAEIYDGVVIIRIDAPLYFANATNVREKIRKYRVKAEADIAERNGTVKYVILEMSPCSHIDSSGMHQLAYMVENHRSRGQEILFVNPSIRVMERLVSSGLAETIGKEFFFPSLHDAVNWCLTNMDSDAVSIHEGSVLGNNADAPMPVSISTGSEDVYA